MIDLIMITVLFIIWVLALYRDMVINTAPVRRMTRVDQRDVECDDCWNEQLLGIIHNH